MLSGIHVHTCTAYPAYPLLAQHVHSTAVPVPREVEATIGARIRCDRYLVDAMTIMTIETRSSIAHPSVSTALGHALLPGPRRHLFRARGCAESRDVVDRNRCELEIDPHSVVWGLCTWDEHAGRSC